ncbi:MAG TPA: hypothetical protein ENK73_06050, partial [Thiomicrospira sp.]|nr:hypothetical protein [Thiomicrospira sp.]
MKTNDLNKNRKTYGNLLVLLSFLFVFIGFFALLGGCTQVPKNVHPVKNFEPNRYLGTWYEIARLDHSFERGLEDVSAVYSKRSDGGIRVINSGIDRKTKEV